MFKSWCAEQNFNNAHNLSHVLMDGGVLSVPFDKLSMFHEKYVEAVKRGELLYVVEQKSERYNFFVDIDYKDNEPLSLEEIKDICKIICDKVKRHGGRDCLISVAPPKKSGDLVKTGVHLNWPKFVVDQSSAIALRDHILIALSKSKGNIDWNEVIDSAVYGNISRGTKGSGFRMPWSYKKAKHELCGGRGCSGCDAGKIDQLSYLPIFVYRAGPPLSAILQINQEPTIDVLEMAVVRTNEPQTIHVESPSISVKEGTFTKEQTKDEVHDEELKYLVQEFIQNNLEGQNNANVCKLFKKKDTYLVSTTSKYCENLKREHSSNHVWFIISGQMILQKCFCLCETLRGRRDGFCKDFVGRRHQLPKSITTMLYPHNGELQKCPEIKKHVEKPQVNYNDIRHDVTKFIIKNMKVPEDFKVIKITNTKNKFTLHTNSNYCETIKGIHEDVVMCYIINGKEIQQKCPKCKKQTSRKHCLSQNIIKILKQ